MQQPLTITTHAAATADSFTDNFNDWYVVQCKPRQEHRAKDNVENQGGEALLFERPVEKIRSGKRVITQELWFPGYLFVRLPREHRLWSSIRSTFGVLRVVRFGERPYPIRPTTFRRICEGVAAAQFEPKYRAGEKVQIKSGSLAGMDAIFANYDGTARAILLVNLLHREQSVNVELSDLA